MFLQYALSSEKDTALPDTLWHIRKVRIGSQIGQVLEKYMDFSMQYMQN